MTNELDPPEGDEDEDAVEEPFESIVLPIEDAIDLHPFAPRDIPSVVDSYLDEARAHGLEEVRLIHGRGKGVQKEILRRRLAEDPRVVRFAEAPADRGGWGATIVWLAPLAPEKEDA